MTSHSETLVTRPLGAMPAATTGILVVLVGTVLSRLLASGLLALILAAAAGIVAVAFWRVRSQWKSAAVGTAIGLLIALPFAFPRLMSVDNAAIICALAIVAISQYVITGLAGQMSLGQGAFAGLGAYGFAVTMTMGLPWPLALIAGIALAGLAGTLIGLIALRLQELYLAMVTLALVVTLPSLVKLDGVSAFTGGANGLILDLPWTPLNGFLGSSATLYLIALGLLSLVAIGVARAAKSRHGLAMRSLEFSEVSARSSGVPLFRYRMASFISASAIAGLGGGVYAMILGIVTPDSFTLAFSMQFLMMIVLGGMRSISGAITGAALIWWLHLNLDGFTIPIGSAGIELLPGAVFAIAVVLTVLFLPEGLVNGVGRLVRWRPRGNSKASIRA